MRSAPPDAVSSRMEDLTVPELEAKVQTYEHIDVVRALLRLFANELLARGETHDRSKLAPAESLVFAEYTPKLKGSTYGGDEYRQFLRDMKPALDHHYANNRHHPEHFGEAGIRDMNLIDVLEMFIDWRASSQRHADGSMAKSIEINQKRFGMSEELAQIFRNTLRDLEGGTLSTLRPAPEKPVDPTFDEPPPLMCDHANEVPQSCPCSLSCYCRKNSCSGR